MKNRHIFLLLLLFISCAKEKQAPVIDEQAYKLEIEQWADKRNADLVSENGWVNLIGLFWLKEGAATFGSDETNDIAFPSGKLPAKAGMFLVANGIVKMNVMDTAIHVNGQKASAGAIIFHPDSTRQPVVSYKNIRWSVINRNGLVGIRARDLQSEALKTFKPNEQYPIDQSWRVIATLKKETGKRIPITNVLGQTFEMESPGTLVFEIEAKEYNLDAIQEGDRLFLIVGDETNGTDTYGAGRYLYAALPAADGTTLLDFNKIENPPCAFTAFATCPLPPKQNVLTLAITAGEKYDNTSH